MANDIIDKKVIIENSSEIIFNWIYDQIGETIAVSNIMRFKDEILVDDLFNILMFKPNTIDNLKSSIFFVDILSYQDLETLDRLYERIIHFRFLSLSLDDLSFENDVYQNILILLRHMFSGKEINVENILKKLDNNFENFYLKMRFILYILTYKLYHYVGNYTKALLNMDKAIELHQMIDKCRDYALFEYFTFDKCMMLNQTYDLAPEIYNDSKDLYLLILISIFNKEFQRSQFLDTIDDQLYLYLRYTSNHPCYIKSIKILIEYHLIYFEATKVLKYIDLYIKKPIDDIEIFESLVIAYFLSENELKNKKHLFILKKAILDLYDKLKKTVYNVEDFLSLMIKFMVNADSFDDYKAMFIRFAELVVKNNMMFIKIILSDYLSENYLDSHSDNEILNALTNY